MCTVMSSHTATNCFDALDADDEVLAARHHFPLLISAACTDGVVTVARRVHAASFSAAAPLVAFHASSFFGQSAPFAAQWAGLMDAGCGGSILVNAIEEMSDGAQILFIDALNRLRTTRPPLVPRLIVGTTVSLMDRVTAGEFSEDLFYRLNVIHLLVR